MILIHFLNLRRDSSQHYQVVTPSSSDPLCVSSYAAPGTVVTRHRRDFLDGNQPAAQHGLNSAVSRDAAVLLRQKYRHRPAWGGGGSRKLLPPFPATALAVIHPCKPEVGLYLTDQMRRAATGRKPGMHRGGAVEVGRLSQSS